ncbi:MAG: hypothetical protein U9Q78_06275 [Chloroflexota bacterium]|nr:hypothetical protein [Chloroflexota bacterium]
MTERKTILTAKEAAEYLRISLFTLGKMEKEELLIPLPHTGRTPPLFACLHLITCPACAPVPDRVQADRTRAGAGRHR